MANTDQARGKPGQHAPQSKRTENRRNAANIMAAPLSKNRVTCHAACDMGRVMVRRTLIETAGLLEPPSTLAQLRRVGTIAPHWWRRARAHFSMGHKSPLRRAARHAADAAATPPKAAPEIRSSKPRYAAVRDQTCRAHAFLCASPLGRRWNRTNRRGMLFLTPHLGA